MNEFLEAVLHTPLLARALLVGALAGLCCASLAPLVVLRRMAFIGDGIAHAAFGGIGLALFLLSGSRYDDLGVQAITLAFCILIALGIGIASRQAQVGALAEDSAIGIAFSVSLALGALFLALRQKASAQYTPDVDTLLFGGRSLLNIGPADVIVLAVLAVVVLAVLLLFQKELLFYTFDAKLAEASGLNTGLIHYLLIVLLVLTVVIASRVVGILLVSASLILPGVLALKLCARLGPAMLLSGAVGMLSYVFGLFAAYQYAVQLGAAVVLVQFALLLLAVACKAVQTKFTAESRGR